MIQKNGEIIISQEELEKTAADLLVMAGINQVDARTAAHVLVMSNVRGIDSHGVRLLPGYLKLLQQGNININPQYQTIREKGGIYIVDADGGLGQVTMTRLMAQSIQKAKANGTCILAVRNATHFGAAGYYAKIAADQGIVSVIMCNSAALMAPWGGAERLIGSNPLAIGFPARDYPFIMDMATSGMAYGKIKIYAQKGIPLPPGMALDIEGNPTLDAAAALKGVLLPAAGPKGYGLAVAIDYFSALLTGAASGYEINPMSDLTAGPEPRVGHFAIFMNLEDFVDNLTSYYDRMDQSRAVYKNSKRLPGIDRIYFPGEIEQDHEAVSQLHGLHIPEGCWADLEQWRCKLS